MSTTVLEQTLRTVPFVAQLGIRVEEAGPGHAVLRMPFADAVTQHGGALHTGAIFTLGELAAGVAVGTHPELGRMVHLRKSVKIKYFLQATADVTAHAAVAPEAAAAVHAAPAGSTPRVDLPVKVLDGHGHDVAELIVSFAFRKK